MALTLLDADPAPAGAMPVVVGGGFGGVLFHEMTGHGLEADHVQKGASVYAGKLGERVAEPSLDAFDDGRLPGEWGHGRDRRRGDARPADAGDPRRPDHLLPLRPRAGPQGRRRLDRQRAPRELRHLPIPRMTNTYIAPGEAKPEELIAEVEQRLLRRLVRRRPGRPDDRRLRLRRLRGLPDRGRQGDQAVPGRDPDRQLPRRAGRIDAVACDFEMKTGFCGKGGQRVPVGTGQGHVRIRELTVGGTAV